ncbi:MAG TPA: MMPL family transporter [Acidimicrobiales bacterium]|nr:MMPL family transporter [Acidimicrobiales bacterium]
MLAQLSTFVLRRRRLVWVGAVVFVVVAGALGGGVADRLSTGGFVDPGAESSHAAELLRTQFGQQDPNLVVVLTAKDGAVTDSANAAAGAAYTQRLAKKRYISFAASFWTLGGAPPLKSNDGKQALLLARIKGDDNQVDALIDQITEDFGGNQGRLRADLTGMGPVFHEVGSTIERDLARAEAIAFAITIVLLIIVFGGVIAASLPLAIGIISILGTFLSLRVISSFTEVSIYALNMTTVMGLGLAIDYSLFVLSRFREELGDGDDVPRALTRTMKTAGRTVVFSALTVAVSLSALLIFPLSFLRSFAYAGIAVVAVACVGSVVVLPAMLAGIGTRVDALSLRKLLRRPERIRNDDEGFWHRLATMVMRRPWPFGIVVVALLLGLGAPFLNLKLGVPDDRVLPPSAGTRIASDAIRANFSSQEAFAVQVVGAGVGPAAQHTDEIDEYAVTLSKVAGVSRVDASTGSYVDGTRVLGPSFISARFAPPDANGTWLSVVPEVEPVSLEGEQLVKDVRSVSSPFPVKIGGASAELVDSKDSLFRLLPVAAGLIAVVSFIALFMMFGGLLVPLKAVVLNLLSLSATFGAMVFIFQDGNLKGLVGDFTATGTLVATTPILMFCIAFGLSMDYEVFLLSRIKEEHDISHDNERSVAIGLEKTGRIVTAAAVLLAVVFLATVSSEVSFIKLFGLGLAMAVVMDATLIRGVLVPAFMRLAGEANWWAPKPLRAFYERFGFSEGGRAADLPEPQAVVGRRDVSDRYRAGIVKAAEAATSEEELRLLLAEENLTVEELTGWGARLDS